MSDCENCSDANEFYRYYARVWDINKANEIIKRDGVEIRVASLKVIENLGLCVEKVESIFGRDLSKKYPNEKHLLHIPEEVLNRPCIVAPCWSDNKAGALLSYILIDGTHRAVVNFRRGATSINVCVLTESQSKECCVEGWSQPRKKKVVDKS